MSWRNRVNDVLAVLRYELLATGYWHRLPVTVDWLRILAVSVYMRSGDLSR